MKRLCTLLALLVLLAALLALPVLAEDTDELVFVSNITVTEEADEKTGKTAKITIDIGADGDNAEILAAYQSTVTIPCDFEKATVTDTDGKSLTAAIEKSEDGYEVSFTVDRPGRYTVTRVTEEKQEKQDQGGGTVLPAPKKEEPATDPSAEPTGPVPEPESTSEPDIPEPAGDEPQPEISLPEALPFTDVAEADWFYPAVAYAYAQALMNGVSDTAFDPNGTTTRAQLAALLMRLAALM